jgi:hypothetical protein
VCIIETPIDVIESCGHRNGKQVGKSRNDLKKTQQLQRKVTHNVLKD